jgi:hypothetical protein
MNGGKEAPTVSSTGSIEISDANLAILLLDLETFQSTQATKIIIKLHLATNLAT